MVQNKLQHDNTFSSHPESGSNDDTDTSDVDIEFYDYF